MPALQNLLGERSARHAAAFTSMFVTGPHAESANRNLVRKSRRACENSCERLRAKPAEKILGMDGLGQDFKFVPLGAGFLEQIGCGCLAGKKQNLDARKQSANSDSSIDPVQISHD